MGPKYNQKFRREWLDHEKLKKWIKQDEKDETKGFCKYCRCSLSGKLYDLLSHAETKKHKSAASLKGSCWKKLEFVPTAAVDNVKRQEVALALFACQHTSNNSVDHLNDLCKNNFDDANKIRIHRTKCTGIIKNILAPHFVKELRNDISASRFSVLVDESTDIGVIKLLGIVIIYFSTTKQKIVSTFLSLAEVTDTTAEGISQVVLQVLKNYNLDLKNLLGIGTDNANVMVGNRRSLYTELKKYVPNLILIRCVCHSIQLALTHSWKQSMPNCLEYLANETYNWFSRSYVRQQSYKHIFEAINNGEEPLKITNICDTRWLSIEVSISRIVDQWTELKTHFGIAKTYEKCFMAQNLYEMYNEINLSYFLFLRPILTRIQVLNKSFQSQNCDPTKLLNDMELAINFLKQFVINPTIEIDVINSDFHQYICNDCYLGYIFENHMKRLKDNKLLDEENEIIIRRSCINFVVNLILEIKKSKLPDNYKILKLVNLLSVENVFKPNTDNLLPLLSIFNIKADMIDAINSQYLNIRYVKWMENNSTCLFWAEILNFKDSAGNNPFKELAIFAIDVLSLPWSNADVERVFSQLNIVKTKLRNRMMTDTVNAVLHVRYGLKLKNTCCHDYEVPKSVLLKVGTNSTYDNNNADDWLQIFS